MLTVYTQKINSLFWRSKFYQKESKLTTTCGIIPNCGALYEWNYWIKAINEMTVLLAELSLT